MQFYHYKGKPHKVKVLVQSDERTESKKMVRLRVKEIAKTKGYNMSSLSRTSNISFNTIKRIFRDPYKEVRTTTLERLAKALGVPTSELIEDIADK